jgi:hypothetical protein
MLDNLRDEANSQPFFQDDEADGKPPKKRPNLPDSRPMPRSRGGGRFLGMTPVQRFILSFMLLVMVCVLGVMFLLISGSIGVYF